MGRASSSRNDLPSGAENWSKQAQKRRASGFMWRRKVVHGLGGRALWSPANRSPSVSQQDGSAQCCAKPRPTATSGWQRGSRHSCDSFMTDKICGNETREAARKRWFLAHFQGYGLVVLRLWRSAKIAKSLSCARHRQAQRSSATPQFDDARKASSRPATTVGFRTWKPEV
jgi:hypothetical protein